MNRHHPPILIAVIALVGAGCSGAPNATQTSPTPTATPIAAPTAAPATTRPSPTSLAATAQMSHGRSFHTATPLADGRVLAAGGYFDRFPIREADLFDPKTNTFTATGSMAHARGFDTATRLADGRVLFAGGDPATWDFGGRYIATAELYDPSTGVFIATGTLATARNMHTATLLLDGRVLIAGGSDTVAHSIDSAEIFDPTTGTFGPTGSMTVARAFHTATLLADGRVLIAGGTSDSWTGARFLASAEIFDPTIGTFSATGAMADKRGSHTATRLADGRVLITGGTATGDARLTSAEIYDPTTGTFTTTGSMAAARTFQEATLLVDGRVLVSGGDPAGWIYDGPFLASAEIYDPKTGTFTATGSMADTLTNHSATLLPDGRVLIAGGYNGSADVTAAELYDPTTGTFTLVE